MKLLARVQAQLKRWGISYDEPALIVIDGVLLDDLNEGRVHVDVVITPTRVIHVHLTQGNPGVMQ